MSIHELDGPSGPDFDAFVTVCAAVGHELVPDDPPITAPEVEAEYFRSTERRTVRTWLARDGGDAIGAMAIELPHAANQEELRPETWVLPAARRQRVASTMLREALSVMEPARTRLAAWVDTPAGQAWCQELGLTHRQTERCSRLRVADIDPDQQRSWIDDAPARTDGYRMVSWRGPCPDEHVEAFCVALDAMADMPVDDLIHDHASTRPHDVRETEATYGDAHEQFASLALGPDGDAAGMTLVWANRNRRGLAYQDDTAVVAAHRGRALGRWLKAANLQQLMQARPELTMVETYNAESNPWMLAINVDMGFKPFRAHQAYQGPLAPALEVLQT